MIPSILIIGQRGDTGAVALATLLRRRGTCSVVFVDDSDFARGPINLYPESGQVGPQSPIDPGCDLIYCRSVTFNAPPFSRQADADYAAAEMHAFGLSWLWTRRSVVVNTPTPGALCGTTPDILLTALACAEVGLDTPDVVLAVDAARVAPENRLLVARREWRQAQIPGTVDVFMPADGGPPLSMPAAWVSELGPHRWTALVCGDDIVGGPPRHHDRLVALARTLDLDVAEISIVGSVDHPIILGISPHPSLLGVGHIDALASYLERRAHS